MIFKNKNKMSGDQIISFILFLRLFIFKKIINYFIP